MTTPFGYFDLLETFSKPGCAICALLPRAAYQYLDSLLYEFVLEAPTLRAFREGRGLCNHHSWQLVEHRGNALGIGILFTQALEEVSAILEAGRGDTPAASSLSRLLGRGSGTGDALADRLEPTVACPACEHVVEVETRYVATFTQRFTTPEFEATFRRSDGLCLPHFRHMLRAMDGREGLAPLINIQLGIWNRLRGELEEFQRKSDHHYSGESMGAEGDSWKRAIAALTGNADALPVLTRPTKPR